MSRLALGARLRVTGGVATRLTALVGLLHRRRRQPAPRACSHAEVVRARHGRALAPTATTATVRGPTYLRPGFGGSQVGSR